jgi:hypothetical protein
MRLDAIFIEHLYIHLRIFESSLSTGGVEVPEELIEKRVGSGAVANVASPPLEPRLELLSGER